MSAAHAWRLLVAAAVAVLVALAFPATARADQGESSFTPSSVLAPIRGIYLRSSADPNKHGIVYECPSQDEKCAVDLADQAALDALLAAPAAVPVGTYDTIDINCVPTIPLRVKGEVDLGPVQRSPIDPVIPGAHYHTSATETLSSGPGAAEYTDMEPFVVPERCLPEVHLETPIEVRAGETLELSALFTLRDLAFAAMPGGPHLSDRCSRGSGGEVCLGFPLLAIQPADRPVTIETYLVSEIIGDVPPDATIEWHRARAGGQVLLLVGQDGEPFGGFFRNYFSQTSTRPNGQYGGRIRTITKNPPDGATDAGPPDSGDPDAGDEAGASDAGDDAQVIEAGVPFGPPAGASSYRIVDFGLDWQNPADHQLLFDRFYREDHMGKVDFGNGMMPGPYYVFRR
jgi:hypothetical protein